MGKANYSSCKIYIKFYLVRTAQDNFSEKRVKEKEHALYLYSIRRGFSEGGKGRYNRRGFSAVEWLKFSRGKVLVQTTPKIFTL